MVSSLVNTEEKKSFNMLACSLSLTSSILALCNGPTDCLLDIFYFICQKLPRIVLPL